MLPNTIHDEKALQNALGRIDKEIKRAIRWFSAAGGLSPTFETDVQRLEWARETYLETLKALALISSLDQEAWPQAEAVLLSESARLCAGIRAASAAQNSSSPLHFIEIASSITSFEGLEEPVRAYWKRKDSGGYRLIVQFGPHRIAHQLLLRDWLSIAGVESEFDYTRPGAGGEREFTREISRQMENGVQWWGKLDVVNCFPSLRPGHFGWLPISRKALRGIVFLPKSTWVDIDLSKKLNSVGEFLAQQDIIPHAFTYNDVVEASHKLVRRGLPQGSVLSPQIARAFLGRELRACREEQCVASFVDDIAVGSKSQSGVKAFQERLRQRLLALPAGKVCLKIDEIRKASSGRVEELGYRFDPSRGHGDHPVHVWPGRKRTRRYGDRLPKRLSEAEMVGDDLDAVTAKFTDQWIAGTPGWTLVPGHSRELAHAIAACRQLEFLNGLHPKYKPSPLKPVNHGLE
ncbi:hypothetical protein KEU06_15605 [Pseudaminobacter sp. 19-2017]|uniref:Reverse transcriptase domain-containing protein n=1 Tax=Pseudaminobacter soli (ex Zhang et al. 2022) TaxID=2831468 RepID=A0A942E7V7_9HYPH|nr:reverse transcriptase domain-containing protein [Pseudaminobacter soli]MBS3650037.1 hypothetical protein [Pseudaminobacter soli]